MIMSDAMVFKSRSYVNFYVSTNEANRNYKLLMHSQILDLIVIMYHNAKNFDEPNLVEFDICLVHLNLCLHWIKWQVTLDVNFVFH
jgi:hypothetical protein